MPSHALEGLAIPLGVSWKLETVEEKSGLRLNQSEGMAVGVGIDADHEVCSLCKH
jgi:hypothetical protein